MTTEHREQGETRQQIIQQIRRQGEMTATELGEALGIGTVGIRQHLALLERDNLVYVSSVRRGVGRPSHLYALTNEAESLFPKGYDQLAVDAITFIEAAGGKPAVDKFLTTRREHLIKVYGPRLADKPLAQQVAELAAILNEQGYMCEWEQLEEGAFVLTQHNCPVDCVAREYRQMCASELTLYEDVLGASIVRESSIAEGATYCRYRIDTV
ncbi:MAG: transcriptional regulator [Chloroflexi bacterium AL-W]|nr:transcriptional regulator [Chloroflexi bacterium AL-N1]NOK66145.1 transcriptional regulator [Chloroflexi bacterium AL-N10]NOK73026.1 transcriptional regulator [Chloroflexi bacterium AL-N5]NOK79923.1 transcriptional regulator [Chloroflexi bacterium AL-W]NOK88221.1 transcriptional regulator [Chloroflexi bacterium AL-N15]